MKNKSQKRQDDILPLLRKRYLSIFILLVILAIILPAYMGGDMLKIAYVVLAGSALISIGLHQNVNFRRLHIKLRPFIVARILQIIVTVAGLLLFVVTFKSAQAEGRLVPHIVLWLLALGVVVQSFGIFRLAREAKNKHPERCDFC